MVRKIVHLRWKQRLGPVEIGQGSAVGANAVVVKDVPAGAVVVGAPHCVRRTFPERFYSLTDPWLEEHLPRPRH